MEWKNCDESKINKVNERQQQQPRIYIQTKNEFYLLCFALIYWTRHDKVSAISIAQLARSCARIFIIS